MMKRLALLVIVSLCLQPVFTGLARSAPQGPFGVKELNFVFLHGAGGTPCDLQLLADSIMEQLPVRISRYERANPGIKVSTDSLSRCYPANVGIIDWANNISESINKHFADKRNLVLIGHSMGGKAALYAVRNNVGGLGDKVAFVVTINTPVRALEKYYITGGGSLYDYCRARWLLGDRGVCASVAYTDSSEDGIWVGQNKHWLAFVSGERAPLSRQFDVGGIDPFPRDMDDGALPISAQYSDGADVIYYGEYAHDDFKTSGEVALFIAGKILDYIFGGVMEYSVFARGGSFEHKADWWLGTDRWEDIIGDVLAFSGKVWHMNFSHIKGQEWEDIVGHYVYYDKKSRYEIKRVRSSVVFTSIKEVRWLWRDDLEDARLYLRTFAAPRNYIQIDWAIYQQGLLPPGMQRDRYEVEIATGTPLTNITNVFWASDDPRDLRLQVLSQAESPFQWFKARWRVYHKEARQRKVIDKIPVQ